MSYLSIFVATDVLNSALFEESVKNNCNLIVQSEGVQQLFEQDDLRMNVAAGSNNHLLGLQIFLAHRSLISIDQKILIAKLNTEVTPPKCNIFAPLRVR